MGEVLGWLVRFELMMGSPSRWRHRFITILGHNPPTGMATIHDKMGHSCSHVCLDMALRETAPPPREGSGRNRHRSCGFDESPYRVGNPAATPNSVRCPAEPSARAEDGRTRGKCRSWTDSRDLGTSLWEVSSSRFSGEGELVLNAVGKGGRWSMAHFVANRCRTPTRGPASSGRPCRPTASRERVRCGCERTCGRQRCGGPRPQLRPRPARCRPSPHRRPGAGPLPTAGPPCVHARHAGCGCPLFLPGPSRP
jgi:hypothetical protein